MTKSDERTSEIPEAAVEAARLAIWNAPLGRLTSEPERESFARAALEAAATHMLAPVLALADERDKTHGTIRGHITTHELRHALNTHDDTQGDGNA